jgi:hypothetical protein
MPSVFISYQGNDAEFGVSHEKREQGAHTG